MSAEDLSDGSALAPHLTAWVRSWAAWPGIESWRWLLRSMICIFSSKRVTRAHAGFVMQIGNTLAYDTRTPDGEQYSFRPIFILPGVKEPFGADISFTGIPGCNPSRLFFCPYCGTQWGAIIHLPLSSYTPPRNYCAENRPCAQHGDGHIIPDSMLRWHAQAIPREVLIYEIMEVTYERKDTD